jgi:SAM-dependent methyltransferase
MDEESRLGVYLLFYWPISYFQVQSLLRMAFPQGYGEKPIDSILDLGSGPAPAGIAVAQWAGTGEIRLTACDPSEGALESAGRLAKHAGINLNPVEGWVAGTSAIPRGPFDFIVLGHLLNELWKDDPARIEKRREFIDAVARELAPTGRLLLLEPALLSTGRELLELRDRLVDDGWSVLAPCFRDAPCPALTKKAQTCHSDFAWTPPATVEELARGTGLRKELVKTTALVLRKPSSLPKTNQIPEPTSDGIIAKEERGPYRVVSEFMVNKAGRTRLFLCGKEGRFTLSAKRGEGFPAEAQFFSLRRSQAITLLNPELRESGLALGSNTRIRIW